MWPLKSLWTETPSLWRFLLLGSAALTVLLSVGTSLISIQVTKLKSEHGNMTRLLETLENGKSRSLKPSEAAFLSLERDGDPSDFLIRKSDEFGLRLIGVRPGDEIKEMRRGRGYLGKQVGVRVQGSYDSIYRFLKSLETGKVFIFGDEYTLERLDDRLLDADLRLFFPTGEIP